MEIFLNVAEYIIKLKFTESENSFYKNHLKKNILTYLRPFISKNFKKKVSANIIFKEKQFKDIFTAKSRKILSYIGKVKNKSNLEIFYIASIGEFFSMLFYILILLIKKTGLMLHASSIFTKKGLILFLGREKSGKSTIVKMLSKNFKVFTDDIIILKIKKNRLYGFQLPLIEKNNKIQKEKTGYKVHSIFFIRKKENIKIETITKKNFKLEKLTQQIWAKKTHFKDNFKTIIRILDIFENFYILDFPKKKDLVNKFFLKFVSTS